MINQEKKTRKVIKLPRAVYIVICSLPAALTILYYALRHNYNAMNWVATRVSAPIRGALGVLSSIYPFSLFEILCVAAGIWLIYYIVRTIVVTARRREKLKLLGKRLLTIVTVTLYVWSLFCWLWNSVYHAPSFAAKNGFSGGGVAVDSLTYTTQMFATKANELALIVSRDEEGKYVEDQRDLLSVSTMIYGNVFAEFPDLECRLFRPKPMLFSWLMSRMGYTGVYCALTGESNINTRAPIFLIPATIAHELAHQCGVAAEDEANFVGILACVTSNYSAYQYAGYLMGLIYLRSALLSVDNEAWMRINNSLSAEVNRDMQDNNEYWHSQKTVETGVDFLDNVLTTVTGTVSNAVNTAYDGYLKSQSQELGIRSYGACVDLLVEYFATL